MQLDEREKSFIWDIVDAISDILTLTENTDYRKFEKDKMRRFAVERQLLVIGEAANHLSKQTRDSISDIPWPQMIGLRIHFFNILIVLASEYLSHELCFVVKPAV